MPVYDYVCDDCGGFDAMRRIAERDDPLRCPRCGADARRVTVCAPALASGASGTADGGGPAEAGGYGGYGMRHVGGCGCCR